MISKLFRNNNDEMIEISYDDRKFYVKNQDRDNIHTYSIHPDQRSAAWGDGAILSFTAPTASLAVVFAGLLGFLFSLNSFLTWFGWNIW